MLIDSGSNIKPEKLGSPPEIVYNSDITQPV